MIRRIFLSASVPMPGRGNFHENADPFLIQFAVRELLTVCLGRRQVVWGGHPAITPMVWAICEDLGVDYANAVALYQSNLFDDVFPKENKHFSNVVFVKAVDNDRGKSLERMRVEMFKGTYEAGVFIGGMEGVLDEYEMFSGYHPASKIVAVWSPGGAARNLADQLGQSMDRIDFARLFAHELNVEIDEPRDQVGAFLIVNRGDAMNLRPLHDRVVVKRLENETKTASGIVIPDSAAEKPDQGEVLAVGPGKKNEKGELSAMSVKVGDRVLFGKYSGQTVKVDGDELLVMKEDDLFAVVEK